MNWIELTVIALLSCGWLLREWRLRVSTRKGSSAVGLLSKTFDVAAVESARLMQEHGEMSASVERERKRAEEYHAIIEGVVAERDDRMKMYYQQAMEHGAAQALLLRQIESLVKQYQRDTKGKMPSLNPAVELVTREFNMNHVQPALEATKAPSPDVGTSGG